MGSHRERRLSEWKGEGKERVDACLVVDSLSRRHRHFLCKDISHSVQFHRLTPIIEGARHEDLVRAVRPR